MTTVARMLDGLRARLEAVIDGSVGEDDHARGYRSGLRAARLCLLDEQARHVGFWGLLDRAPSGSARLSRAAHALDRVRYRLEEKSSAVDMTLVRGRGFQDAVDYALREVARVATTLEDGRPAPSGARSG